MGEYLSGAKYHTVEYGNNDKVTFLHLNSNKEGLKVGDQVYEGQKLGLTGKTGTTQPHLHISAKDKDGNQIDPENRNYGNYTSKEFFEKYEGDYTKLPTYTENVTKTKGGVKIDKLTEGQKKELGQLVNILLKILNNKNNKL